MRIARLPLFDLQLNYMDTVQNTMKKLLPCFFVLFLLTACYPIVEIPTGITLPVDETSIPTPTVIPYIALIPTTEMPAGYGDIHIYCGEDLQLLGTLEKDISLTLFKANGLEYFAGGTFIKGELVGEVLVSSEIRGTNLRLQNNTFTKSTLCYLGLDTMQGFIGTMLPVSQLINERSLSEQFEGSILVKYQDEQYQIEWLTYRVTSSSKKSCILYKIIQDTYPCNQNCAAVETEPGCECFCANFLYYDENCIPTEINPDFVCFCR